MEFEAPRAKDLVELKTRSQNFDDTLLYNHSKKKNMMVRNVMPDVTRQESSSIDPVDSDLEGGTPIIE